jgi:hypothetical protein
MGCAADRPIRNGVPNENLYLRKAFIIQPGSGSTPQKPVEDDGWMLKATVMEASTPNPLANEVLFPGAENNGMYVRFVATQDHLQLVNLKELSSDPVIAAQETRVPEVINSWPATHGDLKLAVTADGEKTNQFQENQELDWHIRQWVRVDLAKSDLSDFALFGAQTNYMIGKCTSGSATTIVPDSIDVDEPNNYIEWKVQVTLTPNFNDTACVESFGDAGANFLRLGRNNVTAVVKYSMSRAVPTDKLTYKPLELPEHDPIRRKYGPIMQTNWARDPDSGQIAARELVVRFDPEKEITLYFAKGYPEDQKAIFTDPAGGIVKQTNDLFQKSGAKIRLTVKNFDQDMPENASAFEKARGREYGDVRYNFIRWQSDLDTGAPFIGVAQFVPDPRTGETLSASINIADFNLKEFVAQRVDAFLTTLTCGASADAGSGLGQACTDLNNNAPWGPPMVAHTDPTTNQTTYTALPAACTPGDVAPIVPEILRATYAKSSLYSKMQEYMGRPVATEGPLGPQDFIVDQQDDFESAYYKLLPWYIFADPAQNQFVTPVADGGEFGPAQQYNALKAQADFHTLTGSIDKGIAPYDHSVGPTFVPQAAQFLDNMKAGVLNGRAMTWMTPYSRGMRKADEASNMVSFTGVMQKAGRHCTPQGTWETKEQWMDQLEKTYHSLTVWHEFGHVLGMEHNFMASVDRPNYPHYTQAGCDPSQDPTKCDRVGMYASSVMEYSSTPDRVFWAATKDGGPGWAPYDKGAIGFIYSNATTLTQAQVDAYTAAAKNTPPDPANPSAQIQINGQPAPYNDPMGWSDDGKTEKIFMYCNEAHTRFTPTCRSFDFGSSPSEIIANEIENYEWQYQWSNFRKYRKVWDISHYADRPSQEILELRRFLPMWRSDWSASAIIDDFSRFGVTLPPGATSKQLYFSQLSQKFDDEMSGTNQMVAAFHLAIIQQSSGERPFATIIDKYTGDVTQQGISLDKQFAMQGWVGLWPQDNYDPNQRGAFISSFTGPFDIQYTNIGEKAASSMVGAEPFDSFPYLKSAAVVLFAKDTHDQNFSGRVEIRDWVGQKVFSRERDMLDYFRSAAVANGRLPQLNCAAGAGNTLPAGTNPSLDTCQYDPTKPRVNPDETYLSDDYHEFQGPDDHRWAYVYLKDRQQYVFVDRDRNIASYKVMRDYNVEIIKNEDETETAYELQKPIKYFTDAFQQYN